jgi:F0F1-type ATP synthase assembly protein I
MSNSKKPNEDPWRAMALVGVVGIDLAVCIFAGYWVGHVLRGWTNGSELWILFGLLLGISAGVVSVIYMIKHFTEERHE